MSIDIVTVVITHMGVTITAVGTDGQLITEEYRPLPSGQLDCVEGNFEDEETVWSAGLVEPLAELVGPASDVFTRLTGGQQI